MALSMFSGFRGMSLPLAVKLMPDAVKILIPGALSFHTSPMLSGEPLKKKKRVDPAIERLRTERKVRRLEKEIRRLKKLEKQYKPIDELIVSPKLLQEQKVRTRKLEPLSKAELIERKILKEEWAEHKHKQFMSEMALMSRFEASQNEALKQLQKESEELYQAAIQPDFQLLPFQFNGPVRTPPIDGFECADGVFKDTTKRWDQRPDLPPLQLKKKK